MEELKNLEETFRISNMTAVFRLWNSRGGRDNPFPGWYRHLSKKGINTEYCPKRYHAIIQRIRTHSKCSVTHCCNIEKPTHRSITALIYQSGNVCLIGGHTDDECLEAAKKVIRRANFILKKEEALNLQIPKHRIIARIIGWIGSG
jgi:TATA-box binding protein (TBP) (component of TFIID and TFIIIB)